MRPTRRAAALGLLAALLPRRARADLPGPRPVEIRAYALPGFGGPARVGALAFRSGLELQSSDPHFGGLSGLRLSRDGTSLVAVSDHGYWLTARVLRDADGRLAGLADAAMAPLLGPDGDLLWRIGWFDAEALALDGDVAYVGIEQREAVLRYAFGRDGVAARGEPIALPPAAQDWRRNRGIEALAVLRRPSPLAGSLVAIAEASRRGADEPTDGFVATGPHAGAPFAVARSNGFDVTDAAVLPGGDLLVLERRFSVIGGVAARIRRIPGASVAPEALLDGPAIFEADWTQAVDNMEGLSVHRAPDGETRLVLVSDDNYSALQRTLLLEFALAAPA